MKTRTAAEKKRIVLLAPSILTADFSNLEKTISSLDQAGADWIHLDIMDGHFVPNFTFGPMVVKAIRKLTPLPLDCHLMVKDPDKFLEPFHEAGVSFITVHAEACLHLHRTVSHIASLGMKAGVSINPATSVRELEEILPWIDLVLLMSVNPGFGGQRFIPATLRKIASVRQMLSDIHSSAHIQVDGGIDFTNVSSVVKAGVDVIVAGNAIFGGTGIKSSVHKMRKQIEHALRQ